MSAKSHAHHSAIRQSGALDAIFTHANSAYRNKDHLSALVLYDYLAEAKPSFSYYQVCRDMALRAVYRHAGCLPTINTQKTTERGKTLRLLHTLIELGYPKEKLRKVVDRLPNSRDRFALQANLHAGDDSASWERSVNGLLRDYGLRGLRLKPPGFSPGVMPNIAFEGPAEAVPNRGLVTICISAHNSAQTLPYAIESILRQDYPHFELLVLDDASTDGTGEVAKQFAAKDARVEVILNTRNRGTYWNRNQALARAKGEFFTILDADDICHPQRIPLQLDFLHQNPTAMGVFGLWFRLDHSGRLTYRNFWGGVIVHEAVATLVFRREPVTSRIGYYDPVKIASDTEYLERIKRVFGKGSVRLMHIPLAIALAHANSLTATRGTGIDNYLGLSKPRRDYRNAWMRWHQVAQSDELFIPYPKADYARPFEAPREIIMPLDCI